MAVEPVVRTLGVGYINGSLGPLWHGVRRRES